MGCDIYHIKLFISMVCFNPRTHMGCDDNLKYDAQLI